LSENPGVLPNTPLALPDGVDALVVIAGNEVLDYGVTDGWRRHTV